MAPAPASDAPVTARTGSVVSVATLYARLEQTETQLTTERQDKARLNTYLTQLVKEVCPSDCLVVCVCVRGWLCVIFRAVGTAGPRSSRRHP